MNTIVDAVSNEKYSKICPNTNIIPLETMICMDLFASNGFPSAITGSSSSSSSAQSSQLHIDMLSSSQQQSSSQQLSFS